MGADPAAGVTRREELSSWLLSGLTQAERALEKDPESIRALALRGELLLRLSYFADLTAIDTLLEAARRDLTVATASDPSYAHAWYVLSQVHELRGSGAEAELAAHKALETDVYAREASGAFTLLYFGALQREAFGEAREHCRQGSRRFPNDPNLMECELTLLAWSGEGRPDVRRAWVLQAELDTAVAISHGRLHRRLYVAAVLARSGMADSARSVMSRTQQIATTEFAVGLQPVEAYVWTLLGEEDRAFTLLTDWFEHDPESRDYWGRHPWFRTLQDRPGFSSDVTP
jgi:tetratricopeptide (TPR) repeat protein